MTTNSTFCTVSSTSPAGHVPHQSAIPGVLFLESVDYLNQHQALLMRVAPLRRSISLFSSLVSPFRGC